jgi:hypothetical protein
MYLKAYVLDSVRRETINLLAMAGKFRRFDQASKAWFKRSFQSADTATGAVHPNTTHASIIQTVASIASDVQMQVCCVRGGGGRVWVRAVTSIGSTTPLKNTQMANVLDRIVEFDKGMA